MTNRILLAATVAMMSHTLHAQKESKWYIPDYYKVQFAGNIGFVSSGAGYVHGKSKLETDLSFGYLPEFIGGDNIITMTLKSTYSPWKKDINKQYAYKPFAIGLYLSYSFGSQFDTILPEVYPDGYYWWASSLRFGGFVGGSLVRKMAPENIFKSISLYYELGTYDLIFISYIQNLEYLSITDVVSLSLGVKVNF